MRKRSGPIFFAVFSKAAATGKRNPPGKRRFAGFAALALLGPALLSALADNDAGGVISYVLTGAHFGTGLFIPLAAALGFVTYTVQEMAMRLGVASPKGYTHLVREKYGAFWMIYQIVSLVIENFITLITEFIGMTAGLRLLGLPLWAATLSSVLLVLSLALFGKYATKEKIAMAIGLFNLCFIAVALLVKPDFAGIASELFHTAGLEKGGSVWLYIVAMIGNAVAPWMIFYTNAAYLDKEKTLTPDNTPDNAGGAKRTAGGTFDAVVGSVCQVLVAVVLLIIGSALSGLLPLEALEQAGPVDLIVLLGQRFGGAVSFLFALGLFNAGLLAAVTVSLSSAWSVAEVFGWSKSLNDKPREAPGFYAIYAASVLLSALCLFLPGLPLNYAALLAQVAGGALLAPVLVFLILLTSDHGVMGEAASGPFAKARAWFVAVLLIAVTLFTLVRTIFF